MAPPDSEGVGALSQTGDPSSKRSFQAARSDAMRRPTLREFGSPAPPGTAEPSSIRTSRSGQVYG